MYKPCRIIVFLAVFVCVALIPILVNVGRSAPQPVIALETPEILASEEQQCIEDARSMRAEHMLLLDAWRTEVVRNGTTLYTNSRGQIYEMSLEEGCLSCHTNRSEFCDSCHSFVAAKPECWSCHIESKAG